MNIEKLIDELDDIIDASWHLPMSGGKVIVDSKEIRRLLEDLRLKLPNEVTQAKNIVADRTRIIEDAKRESEAMIRISEEKIRSMVSKSEIVKSAQLTAGKIVSDAKVKSREMKAAANEYVEELMKQTDQIMTANLSEVRKARQSLKADLRGE